MYCDTVSTWLCLPKARFQLWCKVKEKRAQHFPNGESLRARAELAHSEPEPPSSDLEDKDHGSSLWNTSFLLNQSSFPGLISHSEIIFPLCFGLWSMIRCPNSFFLWHANLWSHHGVKWEWGSMGAAGYRERWRLKSMRAEGNQSSAVDAVVPMDTGCSLPDHRMLKESGWKSTSEGSFCRGGDCLLPVARVVGQPHSLRKTQKTPVTSTHAQILKCTHAHTHTCTHIHRNTI